MTLAIGSFNQYQKLAHATAVYPGSRELLDIDGLAYVTLGLNGEAGEIAEKVKKIIRDNDGSITAEHRVQIKKEAGDVLWYLAELCSKLGITLEEVAEGNIDKLLSRRERGVIHGNGDDR